MNLLILLILDSGMGISQNLRKLQDQYRNAGWRIQWIPWQEPGKPEFVFSLAGLIGAAIFVGVIVFFLFWHKLGFGLTMSAEQMLAIAGGGLVFGMYGIIFSALKKQAGWKRFEAVCIDREIREGVHYSGRRKSIVWAYRLVCVFNWEGKNYTVTPEPSHLVNFKSEQQAEKYLCDRIQEDGRCRLWINPKNPMQTIFHKRCWWL